MSGLGRKLTAALTAAVAASPVLAADSAEALDGAKEAETVEVAEPPETEEPSPFAQCAEPKPGDGVLAQTSKGIHLTVCGAALWFDGLFGEGDLDAARGTHGEVSVTTGYTEFDGDETRVRFNAKVQLPAMQNRLSLFVGRDDEEQFTRDRTERETIRPGGRTSGERDGFVAGFGFDAFQGERFQSQFRIGAQDPRLPKVFVQNRFNWLALDRMTNRIKLRMTPFWNNRDRTGITVGSEVDHLPGDPVPFSLNPRRLLLRWTNTATLTERSPGLQWRSALVLLQELRNESALAYETFITGATRALEPVRDYGVRLTYRRGFFKRRLYLELAPEYSWPRIDPTLPREGSAGIYLTLELPFGRRTDR